MGPRLTAPGKRYPFTSQRAAARQPLGLAEVVECIRSRSRLSCVGDRRCTHALSITPTYLSLPYRNRPQPGLVGESVDARKGGGQRHSSHISHRTAGISPPPEICAACVPKCFGSVVQGTVCMVFVGEPSIISMSSMTWYS